MKKSAKKSFKERFLALPMWFWVVFAAVLGTLEIVRRICFGGGCLLMDIFNFPCPTCGMTRAMLCAVLLRFNLAMSYNPAFWTAPLSAVCLVMAFADKKRKKVWFEIFVAAIAVLLGVWVILRVILREPIPN